MAFWTAALALGAQAFQTGMSAWQNKQMQNMTNSEFARQQAHYGAMAAQNPLEKASNRALLSEYDREADRQREIANNKSKIMGYTPEYTLGVEQAIANGRAQTMTGIEKEQSALEDKYLEAQEQSRQQQYAQNLQYEQEQKASIANGLANAGTAFASTLGSSSSPSKVSKKKNDTGTAVAGLSGVKPGADGKYFKQNPYTFQMPS